MDVRVRVVVPLVQVNLIGRLERVGCILQLPPPSPKNVHSEELGQSIIISQIIPNNSFSF